MVTQVLFIHGGGEGAYAEDARLAASLARELGAGYSVHCPQMPNEREPDYTTWKNVIVEDLARIGDGAILVGHSIGASIIIKLLCESETRRALAGVFLVAAPFWHDHEIWRWEDVQLPHNASARLPGRIPLFFYHGLEDEVVPYSHAEMYAQTFPQAIVRGLSGRNHQLNDDLSEVARDIRVLG